MSRRTTNEEDAALVAGVRAGDEAAFVALTEPYRRQLHLHCYRMLGSFDDAEDLVQETLLRAWKGRAGFEGRAMVRTWLYRIATNACLDLIESKSRRLQSIESPQAADSYTVDWLQPYPDRLLDQIASSDSGPDALVIERETIELAYLAAIQHLPPRQRAILILRDALGWSAKETARLLEESVASVNSALHRARSSMRQRLPERRLDWSTSATPTTAEMMLLERYMDATDRADVAALTALLREEALLTMPPFPTWFKGRGDIATAFEFSTDPSSPSYLGQLRTVATAANRQPAVAAYVRRPGDSKYRALGTKIAFDQTGEGPPVILVVGAFNDRSTGAPLAKALESQFTVLNYDRRGRGASGDTLPYAVEREVDDLDALIREAGGAARVFGYSSGGTLALDAAARGLNITKLALYEAPFMVGDDARRPPKDMAAQLARLISSGHRGDAVELFQTRLVGIPEPVVAQLRHAPFRPALEATAHTLVYEASIVGDLKLPTAQLRTIKVPTLVVYGSESPVFMGSGAKALAEVLPNGHVRALPGQTHDIVPAVLAPVLLDFFGD